MHALASIENRDAWSTAIVPEIVAELADPRDRALAGHLAYEALRWQGSLDLLVAAASSRDLDDVEAALLRVLRLGALQLWRSAVPPHAAVDTSVQLARTQVPAGRADGAAGFVNGVLRQVARRLAADPGWLPGGGGARDGIAFRTGHPRWIVDDLAERVGDERAEQVLAAASVPAGTTLRATVGREALLAELAAAGIDATPGEHAPEAVHLPGGVDPRTLPAVLEGRARPQDEASMLVVHAGGVRPGERVLDLCAGPGGKATHLAALAGPEGRVVGIELHEHRARQVADAAAVLGVEVDVRVGDALDPPLDPGERFDVVLLDAPCTGLGTGRRRPEVRWRRTPDDVEALAALQRDLLAAAGRWLAPGGRLVYAVCTWTGPETDRVLDAAVPGGLEVVDRRQLLPDVEGTDGMFVAVLRHVGEGSTQGGSRTGVAGGRPQ